MLLLPILSFASDDNDRVVIIISDSSILKNAKLFGISVADASEISDILLKQEVEDKLDILRSKGLPFNVIDIMTFVIHGVVIETSYSIDVIQSMIPGTEVYQDISLKINLEKSSKLVRATEANNLLSDSGEFLTGKGVVVAILDTGIDYNHPDLGGTFGLGQKIIGGYDFVDNDEDPLDEDGHGTAVAGIISANGVLTGIAPESSLLAYRVVDKMGNVKSSDLIRALERASKDGADIINLSLGTSEEIESLSYAVQSVIESGIVVVAATGNSAHVSFGEPAGRKEVIAVGASQNNITTDQDAAVMLNHEGFELIAAFMNGSKTSLNGVSGDIVYVNYARENDVVSLDLTGKIALAERGGDLGELVYFSEKEANVVARGAIGLIVYNNGIRGLFLGNLAGPHNPPNYSGSIPVVSLSGRDGLYLLDKLNNGSDVEVTVFTHKSAQILSDSIAYFSSIGPISSFYLKPDIVAPGVNVNSTSINGTYVQLDGTSFATPHVSGAAALLLQLHPDLTPNLIAGILAPTSKVLIDQFQQILSSSNQGSGRLDVFSAVNSPLALDPYYLVFHLAEGQSIDTKTLEIVPVGNQNISVDVDILWDSDSNISITFNSDKIDVTSGITSELIITTSLIDAYPASYEGRITLRSLEFPDLTIPVVVLVSDASLALEKINNTFVVSILSDENIDEAVIHVIAPNGATNEYVLEFSDSVSVDFPFSGEYWVEAIITTPTGKIFARSIFNISDPIQQYDGIPLSFLEIFSVIMMITLIISVIMMALTRINRNQFELQGEI
ncbi:S8 family serine peptidase [Thermoproteota archaeon]